jgi:hypothetical protein
MLAILRAALVISTPVSNFILNPETTHSYLFILLKIFNRNSFGTTKINTVQYTSAVCNVFILYGILSFYLFTLYISNHTAPGRHSTQYPKMRVAF